MLVTTEGRKRNRNLESTVFLGGGLVKTMQHKPRPIRPRLDEDRLSELLDVAAEVFMSEGFSAASTNDIARRANSSKTTFYSRFPTKEQLFLAVIERRMTGIFQQFASSLPEDLPIEDTLRDYGSALIRVALSKEQLALVRVISMEAAKFPELGKRFYELGPKRGEERLAAYLTKQVEKGRLINDDTRQMAQHFMSLITGGPIRWFVLGFDPSSLSKRALQKHLNSAIRVFMRAYRRTPASKTET
jgi:TetR/AcrR family transcriptional regulator, mexJK operon transcriptional repressor